MTQLFVGHLPNDVTEEEVRDLFEKYGKVSNINLKRNFGFVTYENEEEGDEAIKSLDGYTMKDDKLVVEKSRGPREPRAGGDRGDSRDCYKCNKPGHIARFCPDNTYDDRGGYGGDRGGGYRQRGGYERKPMACFNCGQEGHKSYDCTEPKRDRARSRSPQPRDDYRSGGRGGGSYGERRGGGYRGGNDRRGGYERDGGYERRGRDYGEERRSPSPQRDDNYDREA